MPVITKTLQQKRQRNDQPDSPHFHSDPALLRSACGDCGVDGAAPQPRKRKAALCRRVFLGSRSLSGVVLAMTLVATYGSVSSFVSGPGIAWKLGLGWVVFAAPQIIAGFFILGLLGKKMALASRASGAITVTGLLEVRFGSRALTVLLSLALLICFCAMMTGQFIGGAAIFAEAAGIDPVLGLLLFGLLTVFYTTFGGFRAVAWTDFVCAVLMIVGMVMLGWAVIGEAGGLTAAMERAAAAQLADPSADLSSSPIFHPMPMAHFPGRCCFRPGFWWVSERQGCRSRLCGA